MLLIIFVFIGFFMLATKYDKNKILWGILGAASYFIFQILIGIVYGAYLMATQGAITDVDTSMFSVANIVGWAVSIVGVAIFYLILKRKWEKEYNQQELIIEEDLDQLGS